MESGFIAYRDNNIHCIKMGKGPKLLIAFHGFDNDARIFEPLAVCLHDEYTLISVDLPGHGQTSWKEPYLKIADLMALVQGIKNEFKAEKFSLIGFSLGGRICLNIVQYQPNWVEALFLIAPDGLIKNVWYYLATCNPIGKVIFKKLTGQPQLWVNRLSWLKRFKIVDESRYKFVRKMLVDRGMSGRVALVWPLMSRLIPNRNLVKWNINKYKITTEIMMGRYDRIIPAKAGEAFVKNIHKYARLHLLESGHALLTQEQAPELANFIRLSSNPPNIH